MCSQAAAKALLPVIPTRLLSEVAPRALGALVKMKIVSQKRGIASPKSGICIKNDEFCRQLDFARHGAEINVAPETVRTLQLPGTCAVCEKMMNFAFKMMEFAFKMMTFGR